MQSNAPDTARKNDVNRMILKFSLSNCYLRQMSAKMNVPQKKKLTTGRLAVTTGKNVAGFQRIFGCSSIEWGIKRKFISTYWV
jgi:hypothetical protein